MLEYFPDPHSGEILYSVWARYNDHVQFPRKTDVYQELFGNINIKATVDLPCHLSYFVDHLPTGHMYTVDYFIDHHTLLPFYGAFRSEEYFMRLREQMISDSGQALHRRAGIGRLTIPSPKWLRYCPRCVQMDRENVGECFWHRLHQVPGVEICPIHRTLLENSTVRARKLHNSPEFISAERAIVDTVSRDAESSPFFQIFMDIALDFSYLLEHPCRFNPHSLRERYCALLSQCGYLPTGSKIRMYDCLKAFMDYYPQTLLAALHCEIKPRPLKSWLYQVIHPSEEAQHPLRHVLTIRFLGSSTGAFSHLDIEHPKPYLGSSAGTFSHLDIGHPKPFGEGPWPCLNPACEHYQQRYITIWQIHRLRLNDHPVGKFACLCGFTYCRSGPDSSFEDAFRRDQILAYGPRWEAMLRNFWFDPALSTNSISRRLGVAPATVKLQAVKLHLPFPRITSRSTVSVIKQAPEKDISRYRAQWLALIQIASSEDGRTALSRRLPGVYDWLSKYDREWLLAHCPPRKPSSTQLTPLFAPSMDESSPREGVMSRDALMAEEVRARAALIIALDPPKRVTVYQIRMYIPQVLQLKSMPEKATLTAQALQEVVETKEAFAVRRIWRIVQKYREKQVCPSRTRLIWSTNTQAYLHVPTVKQALDEAMCVLSQFA